MQTQTDLHENRFEWPPRPICKGRGSPLRQWPLKGKCFVYNHASPYINAHFELWHIGISFAHFLKCQRQDCAIWHKWGWQWWRITSFFFFLRAPHACLICRQPGQPWPHAQIATNPSEVNSFMLVFFLLVFVHTFFLLTKYTTVISRTLDLVPPAGPFCPNSAEGSYWTPVQRKNGTHLCKRDNVFWSIGRFKSVLMWTIL